MPEDVLISIIMPCFNGEQFLEESINSVRGQQEQRWELLIVDGGSTDNSRNIITKYSRSDNRIKFLDNPDDQGPAQARAFGISFARGEFIAFIDSDDCWLSQKLSRQLSFMLKHRYSFTYTDYRLMDERGKVSKAVLGGHTVNNFKQYLRRRGIANSSVMLERKCINADVLSAQYNIFAEDTLWWLLILYSGHDAHAIKEPLLLYRISSKSRSRNFLKNQKAVWKMYRIYLNLSTSVSAINYLLYIIDVLKRRIKFKVSERMRSLDI